MPTPRPGPSSLHQLPGVGPASAAMLARAGLHTLADVQRLGSVAAFARVRASGQVPNLNLLWALERALTGQPWQTVAREHRTSLLLALDDLPQPPTDAGSAP